VLHGVALRTTARAILAQAEFGLSDADRTGKNVRGAGRHNGPSISISPPARNLAGPFRELVRFLTAANRVDIVFPKTYGKLLQFRSTWDAAKFFACRAANSRRRSRIDQSKRQAACADDFGRFESTSRCRRRACPGDPERESTAQAESRWPGQARPRPARDGGWFNMTGNRCRWPIQLCSRPLFDHRELPGGSRKRCINTRSSQRPNLCPTSRK